ncbi:MAG: hypothetical protein CMJ34_13350 [Phycisphaerae bacterium]|nr:hypothetical protein [Phycisphaerae bacterium]
MLVGCGVGTAAPAPASESTCSSDEQPDACLGIGPSTADVSTGTVLQSVRGTPLAVCSEQPMTGFFRDGLCRTGPEDRGVHVVCAEVDADFLDYTARQGNALSTPRPRLGFAGLQPGDRWCLCAARWEEARTAGVAPKVVLQATHPAALRSTTLAALDAHAVSGKTP